MPGEASLAGEFFAKTKKKKKVVKEDNVKEEKKEENVQEEKKDAPRQEARVDAAVDVDESQEKGPDASAAAAGNVVEVEEEPLESSHPSPPAVDDLVAMPEGEDGEWNGEPLCFGSVDQDDEDGTTWNGEALCFGSVDAEDESPRAWGNGNRGAVDVPPLAQVAEEELHASESRLDFVTNSRDAVEIYSFEAVTGESMRIAAFLPVQSADCVAWSPDGSLLGLLDTQMCALHVHDAAADYDMVCEVPALIGGDNSKGVTAFHFSPQGTYAVCYEPLEQVDGTEPEPNVGVWQLATQPLIKGAFVLERMSHWPVFKWTEDERWCCRLSRDSVQVFDGGNTHSEEIIATINCEGVTAIELSQGQNGTSAHVAVFIPARKGEGAMCHVYSLDDCSAPTAKQELSVAQNASMYWNHDGTALLILSSTEVDDTGQSYYGNTSLYILRADGAYSSVVVSAESGPVHDVAWCPTEDEFLLLRGDLPCAMTLHDGQKADQQLDFGKGKRNTIKWSPLGRFFVLGGFGQLVGDIDFWDRPSRELIGQTRYQCCVDCAWSADGRHLLGSTTAPRMRVENRIELFDYTGERLFKLDFEELYGASWRPMPHVFRDRPPTPGRSKGSKDKKAEPWKPSRSTAYQPPKSSGSLAARLRAEEEGGVFTRARTASEHEAEIAREKARKERAEAMAEAARKPTPKEYRDVPVPWDLVGGIIGPRGTHIRELGRAAGIPMEVRAPPPSAISGKGGKLQEGSKIRIGPAGPWDDLDKAEKIVLNKLEELKEEEKNKKKRPTFREVPIPDDLQVRRIIGTNGQTIQELSRQAGMQLQVREKTEKDKVVVIGSSRTDSQRGHDYRLSAEEEEAAFDKAEQIVLAKFEELRDGNGKGSGKNDRKGGKGGMEGPQRELTVPAELVGGLIGSKGATIEEISYKCGPERVYLRVMPSREGENLPGKVFIGQKDNPVETALLDRAEELINEKLEELRANKGKGKGSRDQERREAEKGDKGKGKGEKGEKQKGNAGPAPGPAEKGDKGKGKGEKSNDAQASEESVEALRKEGSDAFRNGDPKGALRYFSEAIAKDVRHSKTWANRSMVHLELGDPSSGLKDAQEAVRLDPKWVKAYFRRGMCEKELGQMSNAKISFSEALRLQPDSPETQELLHEVEAAIKAGKETKGRSKGGRDEAASSQKDARKGGHEEGAWGKRGAHEESVPSKPPSKATGPDEAAKLRREGNEAYGSGDLTKAVELFTKALKAHPRDEKSLANRSAVMLELGNLDKAMMDAAAAAKIKPDWAKAFFSKR